MVSRHQPQEKSGRQKKGINIHPEFHKAIGYRAVEEGISKQEAMHRVLCTALGREDLLNATPADAALSASSA